ncbi:glycerophosphocholine phosphodiesterase GPCPD1 [Drosophila obscura]|uniref:glycerophosphocholine phosphodiesterase GPCPD1 n=1 Tax=Drosophila obscura TaxID=7282 RepID=UPI001BB2B5D4|nr:glycerophosphocholine phosphodiesterase GPCPD1 [Drosophila obscura]
MITSISKSYTLQFLILLRISSERHRNFCCKSSAQKSLILVYSRIMHRWFFANEREECDEEAKAREEDNQVEEDAKEESVAPPVRTTEWPFCVLYPRPLQGNEYLAITGNCESLGDWDPQKVVVMDKNDCSCENRFVAKTGHCQQRFEATVIIPRNIDIHYRFCVVVPDGETGQNFIRFWESRLESRVIRTCQNMLKDCDRFGYRNETDTECLVDRGWATSETYIHFKIFNAPFLWQQQSPRLLYVHIQPMFEKEQFCPDAEKVPVRTLKRLTLLSRQSGSAAAEEIDQSLRLAYTEVANLRHPKKLRFQPYHGVCCGPEDMQLYHCSIGNPQETHYRLDLYTFAHKSGPDEPPYHYGYGFVNADQLVDSEGHVVVSIICASTHRPLIEMCLRYLIIRPLENFKCDMRRTYERYWRRNRLPMDIGHRGSGTTYCLGENLVRENTLYGFKQAAVANADMVEFDVQLTKDAQVVVYHDFVMKFLLQRCASYEELLASCDLLVFPFEKLNRLKLLAMGGCKRTNHIAVPFEAFTYDQLTLVRVLRFAANKGYEVPCDRMLHEQRPFPLLLDLFEKEEDLLPQTLGFNIEIKFPQLDSTRRWEDECFKPTFDRNVYVDTILEIVLQRAGSRRILFSCFDADICTMVRLKQNLYPVVLLTANPECPVQYLDKRVSVLDHAAHLAHSLEFFGLAMHTNTVLQRPEIGPRLQQLHLQALVWGSVNADIRVRNITKKHGVVGIIYDRLDQLDQVGEELPCGNLCIIDSPANRKMLKQIEEQEWRAKCGYNPEA